MRLLALGFAALALSCTGAEIAAKTLVVPAEAGGFVERIGYWVVDSGVTGPVFAVTAEQHGNELSGVKSVRDFVRLAERELKRGKVIGVPFMNPKAARRRMPSADLAPGQPYIESVHNMQTLWSSPEGNDTARLADAIWRGILVNADCILDVHCYPKFCAPIGAVRDDPKNVALGEASGMKFVNRLPLAADWQGHIRTRAVREGKLSLGIELSGQYEVSAEEAARGVRVAVNVAKYLKIFDGNPAKPFGGTLGAGPQTTVYSPGVGVFLPENLKPGDWVEKGGRLGCVLTETLGELPVVAPHSGWLMRFVGRPNCDVDLRDHSSYIYLDDMLAKIRPSATCQTNEAAYAAHNIYMSRAREEYAADPFGKSVLPGNVERREGVGGLRVDANDFPPERRAEGREVELAGVRWIRVPGLWNFRDAGGWNGLPKGRVYRGSALWTLGEGVEPIARETRCKFAELGVRTDLDLRGKGEREGWAVQLSELGLTAKVCPIVAYGGVFDPAAKEAVRSALMAFADPANYPIYVHCAGGADRTGTIVFLVQAICGVSDADLAVDYELTSFSYYARRCRAEENAAERSLARQTFRKLMEGLAKWPGKTLSERAIAFAKDGLGLSAAEVESIRSSWGKD